MRAVLLAVLLLPGCYLSHERAARDAAVPVADAGVLRDAFVPDVSLGDAGRDASTPDAGVCAEPLVTIAVSPIRCGPMLLGGWRQVLVLDINNRGGRAIRVTRWPFGIDRGTATTPEDCAPRTISWMRMGGGERADMPLFAQTMLVSRWDGINYEADFHPDGLVVPPGISSVHVHVNLTRYVDGGCSGWTTNIGFFAEDIEAVWDDDGTVVSDGCVCAESRCVLGYVQTGLISSYRAVLNTWPDITAWTRPAAGEQEIARFRAANSMNEGSYIASITDMALGFSGLFSGDERPRTLRVYRDAVAPENLLASTSFPTGELVTAFWRDGLFTDLDVEAGTLRDVVVTLDADGVFSASTLAVELLEARWTDGVSRSVRSICDGPATAGIITFAPAP